MSASLTARQLSGPRNRFSSIDDYCYASYVIAGVPCPLFKVLSPYEPGFKVGLSLAFPHIVTIKLAPRAFFKRPVWNTPPYCAFCASNWMMRD